MMLLWAYKASLFLCVFLNFHATKIIAPVDPPQHLISLFPFLTVAGLTILLKHGVQRTL